MKNQLLTNTGKILLIGTCLFVPMGMSAHSVYAQGTAETVLRRVTIPSGTIVKVKVLDEVGSDVAVRGDTFRVCVAGDDSSGLPTGTVLTGRVGHVHPATPNAAGILDARFAVTGSTNAPPVQQANSSSGQNISPYEFEDATAHLTGRAPHGKGNATGIAAIGGALLGLSRKGKLGDAIEGGVIGGVGGTVYDQSQKKSASDIHLKKGDEISITLQRSMTLKTLLEPSY